MGKKLITTSLLAHLIILAGAGLAWSETGNPTKGTFWYIIDNIAEIADDAEAIIWVTLPPEWHGQELTLGEISPPPVAILDDTTSGNRIIEWRLRPEPKKRDPLGELSQLYCRYDFTVREIPVNKHGPYSVTEPYDRQSELYRRYTAQEPGLQTDGPILDLAREIAGDRKDPYVIGRRIYGWIMDNLEFVPRGSSEWDAMSVRENREGNCDQFSTLFVALCRSLGIPARTLVNTWTWGGRHVFAELYLPQHGWIPADPTLGQLLTAGRGGLSEAEVEAILTEREVPLGDAGWVYGNMFSNRLIITQGKNVRFHSPTLERTVTLQTMAPGGIDAHPPGFRIKGFNQDIVHGGFYVFADQTSEEEAHVLAHQRLANRFFRVDLDDFDEDACRKASSQFTGGVQNWINTGKSYLHKGEYYKAEAAFRRSLRLGEIEPRENQDMIVWIHNYLGNCYDLLGRREMALAEYNKAIALANDFHGADRYAKRYLKKPFTKD